MRLLMILVLLMGLHAPSVAQPEPPPCYAAPMGCGTHAQHRILDEGVVHWWYYEQGYRWHPVVLVKRHDYRLQWPDTTGMTIPQALEAMWRANVTLHCHDPAISALCERAWTLAIEGDDAHPGLPAPPRYVVARNQNRPDRPMYERVGDDIGAQLRDKRATVGADCWCMFSAVQRGSTTYCALAGEQRAWGEVAVCMRVE